jgi:Protein of unknown function (DUF4239)
LESELTSDLAGRTRETAILSQEVYLGQFGKDRLAAMSQEQLEQALAWAKQRVVEFEESEKEIRRRDEEVDPNPPPLEIQADLFRDRFHRGGKFGHVFRDNPGSTVGRGPFSSSLRRRSDKLLRALQLLIQILEGAPEPDGPNSACRPQYEWLSTDQIWYTADSMNEWIHSLPVWQMALLVFAITYLAAGGILAIVIALAKGERVRVFKQVSAGLLPPLGIIFGLMVVFSVAEVGSDIDRANMAVDREASAIRMVVLLAASFPGGPEAQIRDLIRRHIDEAVSAEWPTMAKQSASVRVAAPALSEALAVALSLAPKNEGQTVAQREIIAALENAMDARRQRIILSRSSVNWVKWTCLFVQAGCTIFAIAVVHCDNRGAAAIAIGIFATGTAVSVLLIASHDRPFSGEISVKPDVLLQVRPE